MDEATMVAVSGAPAAMTGAGLRTGGDALPTEFDYIVVGAGAAGCVLAARLSEDPSCSVLLLEAGGRNEQEAIAVPGYALGLGAGESAYQNPTVPQQAASGRVVPLVTGKGLGGGSSINAMWWFQGQPGDYDAWAAQGAEGWPWEEVRPYFRRIEDHELGASAHHGSGGPMAISSPRHLHPFSVALLRAGAEQGWPISHDLNGSQRVGVALPHSNIRDGARHSTVDAYLRPALARRNLTVVTDYRVEKVTVEDGRATGVRGGRASSGRPTTATAAGDAPEGTPLRARRSVVLAAGAVRTPQLLMLSGIGPAGHLREHGIGVMRDSPGVGRGLQDHPGVVLAFPLVESPSLRDRTYRDPKGVYRLLRRGPLPAMGQGVAALSLAESDRGPGPDVHASTALLGADAGLEPLEVPALFCQVALVDPHSRGRVGLTSADPRSTPAVDPAYLSAAPDRERLRTGVVRTLELFASPALREIAGPALAPLDPSDESGIDAFIDANLVTYQHPAGGARMGLDGGSVVDPRLAVHGIAGLHVADASVMPSITRGNTQAPVIAIAERAADLLLGRA